MNDLFDPTKESHHLQYFDIDNLYSWVMSQNPPTGRLRWVLNPDKLKDSIIELAKEVRKGALLEVGKGYLLKVDMSHPDDLHDLHCYLPFMCKKRKVNWSKYHFPIYTTSRYI